MDEPLDQLEDNRPNEDLGIGWKILAFLIPLAGAIMFFNHRKTNEKKSQSACYAALFGMAFSFVLRLVGMALASN